MKWVVSQGTLRASNEQASDFLNLFGDGEEIEMWSLESIRTLEQNKKMWPMLKDISDQARLQNKQLKPVEWKYVITAAWRQQHFIRGLTGELVAIPLETRKLNKKPFSELIELLYVVGTEYGVTQWSEPALKVYEEYREAQ